MLTPSTTLRRARALLVERGWHPFEATGQLCVYSAVGLVATGRTVADFTSADIAAIDPACVFVDRVLGEPGIAGWEMRAGRIQAEVLALLAEAAELADQAGRTAA